MQGTTTAELPGRKRPVVVAVLFGMTLLLPFHKAGAAEAAADQSAARIRLDRGHPWRPPFGLERGLPDGRCA